MGGVPAVRQWARGRLVPQLRAAGTLHSALGFGPGDLQDLRVGGVGVGRKALTVAAVGLHLPPASPVTELRVEDEPQLLPQLGPHGLGAAPFRTWVRGTLVLAPAPNLASTGDAPVDPAGLERSPGTRQRWPGGSESGRAQPRLPG